MLVLIFKEKNLTLESSGKKVNYKIYAEDEWEKNVIKNLKNWFVYFLAGRNKKYEILVSCLVFFLQAKQGN